MSRIATRLGHPAYENPPAPIKAAVTMAEWLDRQDEEPSQPKRSWPEIAFTIAVFVGLVSGTIAYCWGIS